MSLTYPRSDLIATIFWLWLGFVAIATVVILGLQRWMRRRGPRQSYAKRLPFRFASHPAATRAGGWWSRRLRAWATRLRRRR